MSKLINCKACGSEIAKNAKTCPHCGAKIKKPIFTKWWFWTIVVLALIGIGAGGEEPVENPVTTTSSQTTEASVDTTTLPNVETTAPTAPETEAQATTVPETDAPPATDDGVSTGEKNALRAAKNYLDFTAFSYSGLIKQLEFEGYTTEEATYGADNCGADWKEQALKKSKDYLDFSAFSRKGLIEQLEFEGFTHEQAVYGADQNGL